MFHVIAYLWCHNFLSVDGLNTFHTLLYKVTGLGRKLSFWLFFWSWFSYFFFVEIENPIYSMSEKHHRRKIMSTYWLIEHDELKLRSLPLFLPPMIAIFLGLFYWDSLPNINTNYSIFVGIWRQRGFPFLSNGFYRYKTLNGTRVLSEWSRVLSMSSRISVIIDDIFRVTNFRLKWKRRIYV